jgi:hypothetical protein
MELDEKELFEGAIFNEGKPNEKRFPFVRVTESQQPKIVKKLTRVNWRAFIYNKWNEKKRNKYISEHPEATYKDLLKEGLVYLSIYQSKREWKIIRSVALEKNLLWKWVGIIPKELRCNVIQVKDAREIKKKFDNYLMEVTKEPYERTDSSKDSPIGNS